MSRSSPIAGRLAPTLAAVVGLVTRSLATVGQIARYRTAVARLPPAENCAGARAVCGPSHRSPDAGMRTYEALHPETRNGAIGNGREKVRQVGEATSDRFTADTAAKTPPVRISPEFSLPFIPRDPARREFGAARVQRFWEPQRRQGTSEPCRGRLHVRGASGWRYRERIAKSAPKSAPKIGYWARRCFHHSAHKSNGETPHYHLTCIGPSTRSEAGYSGRLADGEFR